MPTISSVYPPPMVGWLRGNFEVHSSNPEKYVKLWILVYFYLLYRFLRVSQLTNERFCRKLLQIARFLLQIEIRQKNIINYNLIGKNRKGET